VKGPLKIETDWGTWWLRYVTGTCLGPGENGSADHMSKSGRKWIYVRNDLDPLDELETVIHEIDHVFDPRAGEDWIDEGGRAKAAALWALGWRRVEEPSD